MIGMTEALTYPELCDGTCDLVAQAALNQDMPLEYVDEITEALATKVRPDIDLIRCLIVGKACYAAALVYEREGNTDAAHMYHCMSHDLLSKAVEAFGWVEAKFAQASNKH